MLEGRESKLKLYAIGIATADKKPGSDQLIVFPVEELVGILGDVSKATTKVTGSIPDSTGAVKHINASGQNTIVASWLPMSAGNRITAPDVYKGETVRIYRYADTSDYYWAAMFREPSIRRLEDVVYAYSNIKSGNKAFDKTTSYWINISTRNKRVQLHTANNDGEQAAYDVIIDTANGTFTVEDNLGNNLVLDSVAGTLVGTINNSITLNTKTAVINTSSDTQVNTNTAEINASSSTTVNCPENTINGNVAINGNLSVSETITGVGGGLSVSASGISTNLTITAPEFIGPLQGNATSASAIG